jgi:pimeloyl-ACP methyl ester carboxylesterase/DNA-binding CsgD family transcriptional regulator
MPIQTKYAKSGDVHIAYQVVGDGPIDLVHVIGWVSHLEYGWENPSMARFHNRLASFSRLILLDKRGTGLSDRVADVPTLEQRMDDLRAVMDAVGSKRVALFGTSEGGPMCALFAATYPERTAALIMYGAYAKRVWSPDYPWAPTPEERQQFFDLVERTWGTEVDLSTLAPSVASDDRFSEWWATYLRRAASPGAAVALGRMNSLVDIRHVLPLIHVPTLILHRIGDRDCPVEGSRYMARQVPGARYIELSGDDHLPWVEPDLLLNEIQSFLTGVPPSVGRDRVLATVLAIAPANVASTQVDVGTNRWRELQNVQRVFIDDEISQQRGRIVRRVGDGFLATFDGPTRAIRCAQNVITNTERLGVTLRAGLHTGECDVSDGDAAGPALSIATRVMELAAPGEVFVTNTVRDLVSGSGLTFQERPSQQNVGLLGSLQVFRVAHPSGARADEAVASRRRGTHLTRREQEVAVLVARGYTNRQIADELVISAGTVERHVANICNKLGFRSRAEIARWAGERGLLAEPA